MSSTYTRLADHVLDGLLDAAKWAQRNELPPEAALAAALETAVNLLDFKRGTDATVRVLEQLADLLRKGEPFEFGWVLAQLDQPAEERDL